jgi:predicted SprT family Zn-dependent metalloprotease
MILLEDFTKSQCQDIFEDMLLEFEECWDLDELFDVSKIDKTLHWLNSNNRKALGVCKKYLKRKYNSLTDEMETYNYYEIYLNPNCLKFEKDAVKIIKETIAHELCHTMPDCMNHGFQFHKNGNLIYKVLGYKIDTTADVDASRYFSSLLPQHQYYLQCDGCDGKFYQDRLSDPVKNPGRYRCTKCGHNLNSYKLNKTTGEYELYKTYEDEPDYKYYAKCAQADCDFFQGFKTKSKQFNYLKNSLERGNSLICPKCGRESIYLYDDGELIS